MFLIDTCVVSDFVQGEPGTTQTLRSFPPHQIGISSITVMEIQFGILNNHIQTATITPFLFDFLSVITLFSFGETESKWTAKIHHQLKKQGQSIGFYDLLIAGTALQQNCILVTSNTRKFERIEGLILQNWRVRP